MKGTEPGAGVVRGPVSAQGKDNGLNVVTEAGPAKELGKTYKTGSWTCVLPTCSTLGAKLAPPRPAQVLSLLSNNCQLTPTNCQTANAVLADNTQVVTLLGSIYILEGEERGVEKAGRNPTCCLAAPLLPSPQQQLL